MPAEPGAGLRLMENSKKTAGPKIWAVGGGKGGVGKSVIAANLCVGLARQGRRVVALDADLGGANLHTFFGMVNPPASLGDFLGGGVSDLNDLCLPTPFQGLSLISGAGAGLEMANLAHARKEKLLRHIRRLDAEHVVVDIGAGSSFNVLDFFLFADRGILVVVPEPTSIENAYHFLKAAFYRKLRRAEPRKVIRELLRRVGAELEIRGIRSPRDLIDYVGREDVRAGMALEEQADSFHPGVLVNRIRMPGERRIGEDIAMACRDFFGTPIDVLGGLDDEILVQQSVVQRRPVVDAFPGSSFGRGVMALADRLLDLSEA